VWSTCFAVLCNDGLPWHTIIAQQGETCVPHITLGRFNNLRCGVDMPLKSGGSFHWEFVDPNKLLASIVEHSPGLSDLYTQALGGGAPGINISAVHDTTSLLRPPCGQLCSLTLAVPLNCERNAAKHYKSSNTAGGNACLPLQCMWHGSGR
jgi:hypothetical protein